MPALVAGAAAPASAHAILLWTDPSPQTTATRPPPQVRLEFSEPVEVAFGAVRVFDGGGVFAFGDARYLGRDPSTRTDAIGLVASVTGASYRIIHADGTVTSIGSLPPLSRVSVNGAVVATS